MKVFVYILFLSVFLGNFLSAYNPALLPKQVKKSKIHLSKGEELLLHGKYSELSDYLKKLKEQGELKGVDQLLACRLLMVTGKYSEALKILEALIKKEPESWAARMLLFDILQATGKKREMRLQQRFYGNALRSQKLKTAPAFTAAGKALANRRPKMALELFQKAVAIDKKYLPAYIEAGYLGLEFFSWSRSKKDFAKALMLDNENLPALNGLALLSYSGGHLKGTSMLVDKMLQINPHDADGLEIKAGILVAEEKYKEAFEIIEKILATNPHRASTMGLFAAFYDMKGDKVKRDEQIAKVHKIKPGDVEVYIYLAASALRQYRTPDAVKWGRKALETDPDNWQGYYQCGMALLRLGEEKEGFKMLDKSFKLNPYNVPAYNMLTVLDRDFKGKELVLKESEHFAVKMPKSDADIIWPYLEDIMEEAYQKFSKHYQIIPKGPREYQGKILVLILGDPESFSVRTMGLPGLGAVGVCFGQVLMMPSPRFACIGHGKGLNWKSTFEHEFLHILILQKTNYKTSRWFTEGISTRDESDAHGNWRSLFAAAGKDHRLLDIEQLESGFIKPSYSAQVPTSYYQAAMTCRFIEEKYGFEAMLKIIDQYAQGKKTETIIPEVCGMSLKDVNAQLLEYYRKHWQKDGKKIQNLKDYIKKEIDTLKNKPGRKELKIPGGLRSWEPVVQEWVDKGQTQKAIDFLKPLVEYDDGDYRPIKKLADIYFKNKAYQKAVEQYQEVFFRNPYDLTSHQNAAVCYEKLNKPELVNREKEIIKSMQKKPGKVDKSKGK